MKQNKKYMRTNFDRILLLKESAKIFWNLYFTINCAKKNSRYFSCRSFGVKLSSLVILYFIKTADITIKNLKKIIFYITI